MATDIFNTDGIADPTGVVKHGTIITNAGVIPSRILTNVANDAVSNLPVIDDIQDKYDARFDDKDYYKSGPMGIWTSAVVAYVRGGNWKINQDNGRISSWTDLSDNGNHFLQTIVDRQPVIGSRLGQPAAIFNNADQRYLLNSSTTAFDNRPYDMLIICIRDGTDPGFFVDGIGSSERNTLFWSAGIFKGFAGLSTGATNIDILPHMFIVQFGTSSAGGIWTDGNRLSDTSDIGDQDPTTGLYIGAETLLNAGGFLEGAINEIVWLNRVSTNKERNRYIDYAKGKYAGLTLTKF